MTTKAAIFDIQPGGSLQGTIRVPGDKSISHRSIIFGSLADGLTEISGFLEGEDCIATLKAFRAMGVAIEGPDQGRVRVQGVGMRGLKQPAAPLDLGNSGTSMRLMAGLLAAQDFDTTLTGDESLSKRPMARVMNPLRQMGAEIDATEKGTAPLQIRGKKTLQAISYAMPMASAQVKSSLLLAGLYAQGQTCVTEPAPTRDHTERMLNGFGYPVQREGAKACLQGGGSLRGTQVDVPSDISSAAFFLVAASIAPGSDLTLQHVGINPTRTGILHILQKMGANLEIIPKGDVGGEPVADIRVRSAHLKGIEIPEAWVPLAIDEFPAVFIAAACASGKTLLRGAEELRVKESDRIQVMADGLAILGVPHEVLADGILIEGGAAMGGGEIDSKGDHRIAMSFAMAGLRSAQPIRILNCENVQTSFPGFVQLALYSGLKITSN